MFAGSLPRGVDAEIYAELIRELRKMGVTTVVDADGEPMRHAVRAEPDVISPNVLEAEELVGHEFNDEEDRVIAVREMVQLGAREAIMTLPDGCVACVRVDGEPALHRVLDRAARGGRAASAPATPSWPATSPRATSGATPAECLRYGVACGAESTQRLGAGLVDPREVERLLGEIEVQRLDAPAEVG